ncbi:F0F1 ATP synthase subunit epsilon [Marinobacter santoriniensis NKSG1]|uniref:ATP synthase epsilon chain n=1 Tax=Marinobacter santoriniensis NKSG1 TaxID=1288826 RepID=M7CWC2_9GAMM|nr:F0F1 ATP synthase subunit epsilon [Marinobacter santoriniensis]EMP56525.1 F0F1 ATP synthase subunit epsilon [Marinobacter santoriniensis NKSG1]
MSTDSPSHMNLKLLLPTEVLLEQPVTKIIAEAENGEFCLLPRHIDFVAALVPGILSFITEDGEERFAAIDRGILVKCGPDVSISAFQGIAGTHIDTLQALIDERFTVMDEHERKARSALARLEASTLRGFLNLEEPHG